MITNYQKYQLQWMIDHGYSLKDLLHELNEFSYNFEIGDSWEDIFKIWEQDRGFGSEIWACEKEWSKEVIQNAL